MALRPRRIFQFSRHFTSLRHSPRRQSFKAVVVGRTDASKVNDNSGSSSVVYPRKKSYWISENERLSNVRHLARRYPKNLVKIE
jgi:hypothetical protein